MGRRRAVSLRRAQPMRLTAALNLFFWPGKNRVELQTIKHFASCIGMQKGCDKTKQNKQTNKQTNKNQTKQTNKQNPKIKPLTSTVPQSTKIDVCCIQETHLNSTHKFSIRKYEMHRVDQAHRPKDGVLTLVKTSVPSTKVQRSEKTDMEYITVNHILPDRNLTICNL